MAFKLLPSLASRCQQQSDKINDRCPPPALTTVHLHWPLEGIGLTEWWNGTLWDVIPYA